MRLRKIAFVALIGIVVVAIALFILQIPGIVSDAISRSVRPVLLAEVRVPITNGSMDGAAARRGGDAVLSAAGFVSAEWSPVPEARAGAIDGFLICNDGADRSAYFVIEHFKTKQRFSVILVHSDDVLVVKLFRAR